MLSTSSMGWTDKDTTTGFPLTKNEGSEVWVKDQESLEETSEESKKSYVLGKLVDFSK